VSSDDSTDHPPISARPGNLMVWLGGGTWRDIEEPGERAGYQATGFVVLLAALVAWGVTAAAVVSVGALRAPAALAATVVIGLLVGALGRVLASAPGRRGTLVGLGLVAVLVGSVLGELAAVVIFGGSLGPQLESRADQAAATAVAASEGGRQLSSLRAERAGLDQRVDQAVVRRDAALLVARCEYRPAPGCPPQLITGDPGRGPEAAQARLALAGADTDLNAFRAERARRAPELDRAIVTADERVAQDRDAAQRLARSDTGLVAHWAAMNDYTGEHSAALLPRLAAVLALILVTSAPLLLRLWRGPTDQDRLVAARRMRRHAEQDAETAIAVRRAEVRAALELDRLAAVEPPPLAVTARAEPDVTQPDVTEPDVTEPAVIEQAGRRTALPVGAAPGAEVAVRQRFDLLDRLPGPLPVIGRAVTGIAGAFVPAPIARLAADRPRPMRMVRSILDEVEEFQISVRHRRKVTVTEEDYPTEPGEEVSSRPDPHPVTRIPGRLDYIDVADDRGAELSADAEPASLERGRRELPAAKRPD
jgi:hypothetical protein